MYLEGSFFVLAGNGRSDWVLNALSSGNVRVKVGEAVYRAATSTATELEKTRVVEAFRRKYGHRIVDEWYADVEICLRLCPLGQPSVGGTVSGEIEGLASFPQCKNQGSKYYESVMRAFDSASEEYDYTISHNYINTWVRKRSINELVTLTRADDVLLEIGCGTGAEAIKISKTVAGIVATDISENMLEILRKKVEARRLDRRIVAARVRAAEISSVKDLLPREKVRIAYSFNGALNCEPEIQKVPEQLSRIIEEDGYFACSVRNTLCLPEAVSHSLVFQINKMAARKNQPVMVSVGGRDIPSYYYSPSRFVQFFKPFFRVKRIIGLPAFLPPAYLNDYYLRAGRVRLVLEKLEFILGERFPFNRLGDQTLFVFQKR